MLQIVFLSVQSVFKMDYTTPTCNILN